MRKLFAEVQRLEARASTLSRAQRLNLALYAFALVGIGLIALEVRQTDGSSREVRSLPGPVITAPARTSEVQPGDRRPVEGTADAPSAATGGAATETVAAPPAGASTGTERPETRRGSGPSGEAGPAPVGASAQPATVTPAPTGASLPFGPGDMPVVVGGGTGRLSGLSLVPQPPPVPALPPRSSGASAVDVGGPSPADPVLAEPPAPRFSGPAFGAPAGG